MTPRIDRGKASAAGRLLAGGPERDQRAKASVQAAYWFVSSRGRFEFAPKPEASGGHLGQRCAMERFKEVVSVIVSGIKGGLFPANPGPPDMGGLSRTAASATSSSCAPRGRTRSGLGRGATPNWPGISNCRESRRRDHRLSFPRTKQTGSAYRESLDESLFVEAGAGTGKTTSLVDRVMTLATSGRTTLDQIAVITFTDAARSRAARTGFASVWRGLLRLRS